MLSRHLLLTSDLPVPVAPTMTINRGLAIVANVRLVLDEYNVHLLKHMVYTS